MGQARNSGRNATLDEKKQRAAGRRKQRGPEREMIADWQKPLAAKGKTGGASGRGGVANRRAAPLAKSASFMVGRSTKPARKRAV